MLDQSQAEEDSGDQARRQGRLAALFERAQARIESWLALPVSIALLVVGLGALVELWPYPKMNLWQMHFLMERMRYLCLYSISVLAAFSLVIGLSVALEMLFRKRTRRALYSTILTWVCLFPGIIIGIIYFKHLVAPAMTSVFGSILGFGVLNWVSDLGRRHEGDG